MILLRCDRWAPTASRAWTTILPDKPSATLPVGLDGLSWKFARCWSVDCVASDLDTFGGLSNWMLAYAEHFRDADVSSSMRTLIRPETWYWRWPAWQLSDGKEFSWQSNEKGRAIAWLAFVDVPDPLDEMTNARRATPRPLPARPLAVCRPAPCPWRPVRAPWLLLAADVAEYHLMSGSRKDCSELAAH